MNARIFSNADFAVRFAKAVDRELGYPSHGVDVGKGKHVPPGVSRTMRYAEVVKHPSMALWAYAIGPEVVALHGRSTQVDGTSYTISTAGAAPLSADWRPPVVLP